MIGGGPQKITVEIGGKIAASLGKALRESQRQVSTFGRNATRTMNDAAIAGKKGFKGIFDNALWQGAAVGATAFAAGIGLSVKKAVEFESAMAEVRKVVDGLDDATAFKAISREIISLSREIPITAAGFAEIYAAAGQAGIARNELNRFARSAAQMGVAFDMTAAQAGDAMAKMRTSMQLDQAGVEQLADAMNHLSNSMASSAPEITDFMLRVGAIGKQVAMTTEQTAAFGSAMIAAGAPPEVAATSFRNLVKSLTKGNSATKRQAAAMADLGLTTTGVATSMQKDASGTIQDVFKRLGKVPAEMRVALTSELFGDEARALAPLLTNTELLAKSLAAVGDKAKYTGSMMKEFKSRSKTVANQSTLLKNNMDGLGIAIGSALLPAMNKLFTAATPLIAGLSKWAEKNEGLTTGIVLIGGALAGLVIALPFIAAVVKAIGTIKLALAGLKIGATIAGFLPAILNPIGLIIAGVVLVGAALVAAYKYFPWFRDAVNAVWGGIAAGFQSSIGAIKAGWQGFTTYLGGAWKVFTGFLTGDLGRMKEGFGQAFSGIKQIAKAWLGWFRSVLPSGVRGVFDRVVSFIKETPRKVANVGGMVIEAIINGLKAKAGALFGWIRNTWSNITGFFGGGAAPAPAGGAPAAAASPSPSRNAAGGGRRPPGRALGGPVTAGMPYIVGEKRRELFVPGMDGAIIPRIARPAAAPKIPPININAPVARQAPTPAPITINAPVTINATGDGAGIRDQVRAAFEDLMAMASSGYRVALND
jgi:TP901 family phage tail tape measure protein